VIPNPWDVALHVTAAARIPRLATTSAGFAFSQGMLTPKVRSRVSVTGIHSRYRAARRCSVNADSRLATESHRKMWPIMSRAASLPASQVCRSRMQRDHRLAYELRSRRACARCARGDRSVPVRRPARLSRMFLVGHHVQLRRSVGEPAAMQRGDIIATSCGDSP